MASRDVLRTALISGLNGPWETNGNTFFWEELDPQIVLKCSESAFLVYLLLKKHLQKLFYVDVCDYQGLAYEEHWGGREVRDIIQDWVKM